MSVTVVDIGVITVSGSDQKQKQTSDPMELVL